MQGVAQPADLEGNTQGFRPLRRPEQRTLGFRRDTIDPKRVHDRPS